MPSSPSPLYSSQSKASSYMKGSVAKSGGRSLNLESREFEREAHLILETVAAELHALSWMTVSPAYLERSLVVFVDGSELVFLWMVGSELVFLWMVGTGVFVGFADGR
ncbi:hypothetical protein POM88_041242 [Heracleum sosnowskyi]|uniref:Uncharacterized protein n=1 Tax=Heracleum sosnowskyi TaxID=360622 RepID=A0AAD8HFT8_9APIA|nr:hypothetical protein POM88_041242 [Heracleum sosnowskyi]